MPSMGFDPTILVFKRAKTFHALDRAAIVIGMEALGQEKKNSQYRAFVSTQ
jgi:hypothetical protein